MLIFDGFESRRKADDFVSGVANRFGLLAGRYDDQTTASHVDLFPFVLTPPIVLVERDDNRQLENAVVESVQEFSGQFAGT